MSSVSSREADVSALGANRFQMGAKPLPIYRSNSCVRECLTVVYGSVMRTAFGESEAQGHPDFELSIVTKIVIYSDVFLGIA